jgi:hypothetical protein
VEGWIGGLAEWAAGGCMWDVDGPSGRGCTKISQHHI